MSQQDDTSMQDLAAAYALGALSPEETRAFEAFLKTSPEAQREVAEYREVGALLATAAPGVAPDARLKERVLGGIGGARVLPMASRAAARSAPTALWIALAASVVLAVGLGATLLATRRELAVRQAAVDSVQATLAATATRLAEREQTLNEILEPGVQLNTLTTTGDAPPLIQLFWNQSRRAAIVHAFRLPPVGEGKVYQLWFIKDGKPVPSVTFNSEADGHALVRGIAIPEGSGITHAALTVEPAGGSQAPTSPVMVIGELTS